jgi:tRNA A-37 threonylcarbamoyl transferase component Bud32
VSAWHLDGLGPALTALGEAFHACPWGTAPPGFAPLSTPRPMRAVYAGALPGTEPRWATVVKVHRPVTTLDRVKRVLVGGRGAREGRVLRRLAALGLPAPEAVGWLEAPVDLLVTRRVAGLEPLPRVDRASRAEVEGVARLLARLHTAGLVHRDLTAANVGRVAGTPVLVDLGGARLARTPLPARRALAHLAQAAHGFLHGATRTQAARALRAWLVEAGMGRHAWRAWIRDVEAARLERLRLHHRRRERRIARRGRHFVPFEGAGCEGVRREPEAHGAWEAEVPRWLAGPVLGATRLKGDRVLRVTSADGRALVLKRYAPVAAGRRSRALRAFRRAVTLEERGIAVARAWLCAWGPAGSGVLVSEHVDAPDLDLLVRREATFAGWPPARRRALLVQLGRALRALHEAEVAHRDLKAPNLLVVPEGAGWRFPLVDVDGADPRYGPIPWARRIRDLARLAASLPLTPSERLRILAAYASVPPRPPLPLRDLASRVHALAEAHRHRLAARP